MSDAIHPQCLIEGCTNLSSSAASYYCVEHLALRRKDSEAFNALPRGRTATVYKHRSTAAALDALRKMLAQDREDGTKLG